ncbi:hypothetical protein GCM10010174_77460 [Kutzneria viridogrisea]|uniref:Monoamine oxidase n=1 Tax=Kutzneria viridogrisea TaxID=47990 RepID=A0ABR6BNS4_9PSEU|nr:monoamine oxidase [Kutzneria viridogrisea]
MPGSSAFHQLRRLAADHRAAERLGMPVAEFRETRRAGALSRRELLRLGAAAGGGLLLASSAPAAAAPLRDSAPRVAVIGAGISGLSTALTLRDAGLPCTVYEAGDRVGGRMYSERRYWAGGQTSEYGGELIDSEHKSIRALCERFGLPLVDVAAARPAGSRDVLHFGGAYYGQDQLVADFGPVYRAVRADLRAAGEMPTWRGATAAGVELSTMSVAEWIETRVPGGRNSVIGRFIDDAYDVEYGAETVDQTAVNLVYLLSGQDDLNDPSVWGQSDERFHIAGGNQRLPEVIAGSLPPGTVELGWRLTALAANPDGTQTLTFSCDGRTRTVRADHTVLTVPLAVLKRLDLGRAGFDPRMRGAIAAMRMGYCTKLNVQLRSRVYEGRGPWPGVASGRAFSDLGFQQTWDATWGQPGQQGILIQYGGGNGAWRFQPAGPFLRAEDRTVRQAAEQVLDNVDLALPGVRRAWTGRATLSAWHLDPNTLGAYSCYPIGYCHRYAGYEGTRQGNVHLAGEHTSFESLGFMNGGVESGQRAAREIIGSV